MKFSFFLLADPAIHASAACFLLISFLLSSDSAMSIQCRSTTMHSRQLSAEWWCQMSLMDDKTPLLWHLAPSTPMFSEAQTWQTIFMPAYFLKILHFSSFLTEGIWKRAVRNFPLQKLKRKSLIYFLVQSGHFSTHCTQSPSSRVSVERLKSHLCCFTCLVMAQIPAWAWQERRKTHSKPAVLQLPYQEGGVIPAGVQQGRRHPLQPKQLEWLG